MVHCSSKIKKKFVVCKFILLAIVLKLTLLTAIFNQNFSNYIGLKARLNPTLNVTEFAEHIPRFNDGIVRIIHQSWKDKNVPNQFLKYTRSWLGHCFHNWSYNLWTDEDNRNLVKKYHPSFLNKYDRFPREIYRADVSRYVYMYQFGGIYTDLDNECLVPFEHLLVNYSIVFGAMDGQFSGTNLKEGYVQNSFFYSVPHHEFWKELLDIINLNSVPNIPEIETGPVLLSKMIDSYRKRHAGHEKTIRVYEPKFFNPYSWLNGRYNDEHCKDKSRMSETDWLRCRSVMKAKGAYVVQYHAHFWN